MDITLVFRSGFYFKNIGNRALALKYIICCEQNLALTHFSIVPTLKRRSIHLLANGSPDFWALITGLFVTRQYPRRFQQNWIEVAQVDSARICETMRAAGVEVVISGDQTFVLFTTAWC